MLRKVKLAYSVERIAYSKSINTFLSFLSAIRYPLSAKTSKDYLLCLLSAVLLVLSFPRSNYWILAWVGFVPLFFALKGKSKFKAFLLSFFTGVVFWLGIIYWLMHVTLAGMIILVLYLAIYFGIFGVIVSRSTLYAIRSTLFFIPSAWVLLEYTRSHLLTGFPWAILGYSQYLNLPAIQIADITGSWGVSFLVMMVNVVVYSVFGSRCSVFREKRKYLLPVLFFIFVLSYGYYKINRTPNAEHRTPIKISVIQANIPQELKWDQASRDFIMERYSSLTKEAKESNPDLIIWPEAAVPAVLEDEPEYYERVRFLVQESKVPLLFGGVTRRDNAYYNSALLVSKEGDLLGRCDKLHLVPFGEYIPLRQFLPFLQAVVPIGDFSAGKEYTLFSLHAKFSTLICFEDLFPELSSQFVKKGADFLVNITNDAWFKDTSAPYQHLQASVFRAVENRVFLVRAANTGVSGFIEPSGKIASLVRNTSGKDTFVTGYDTQEISISRKKPTFYARHIDGFILVCALFVLYGIIFKRS